MRPKFQGTKALKPLEGPRPAGHTCMHGTSERRRRRGLWWISALPTVSKASFLPRTFSMSFMSYISLSQSPATKMPCSVSLWTKTLSGSCWLHLGRAAILYNRQTWNNQVRHRISCCHFKSSMTKFVDYRAFQLCAVEIFCSTHGLLLWSHVLRQKPAQANGRKYAPPSDLQHFFVWCREEGLSYLQCIKTLPALFQWPHQKPSWILKLTSLLAKYPKLSIANWMST